MKQPHRVQRTAVQDQAAAAARQTFIAATPRLLELVTGHTVRTDAHGLAVARAGARRVPPRLATLMVSAIAANQWQPVQPIAAARQPQPVRQPLQMAILRAWLAITPTVRTDARGVEVAPADV